MRLTWYFLLNNADPKVTEARTKKKPHQKQNKTKSYLQPHHQKAKTFLQLQKCKVGQIAEISATEAHLIVSRNESIVESV